MPAPQPPLPASYSTAEVARLLGVSAPTIQRWVDSGFLQAWKTVGGHRRIEADSVHRVLAAQQPNVSPQAKGASRATPTPPQPLSVMLVDDNPDDRDILTALVESALPGTRIVAMHDGFEALIAMGRAMPDVLITDIVMPHMSGVEMLRRLSAQPAHRPQHIFAVSSCDASHPARQGGLPPDVVFFSKPVAPRLFAAALHAAVASGAPGSIRPS
jgi:excisionase family DNA binding protein